MSCFEMFQLELELDLGLESGQEPFCLIRLYTLSHDFAKKAVLKDYKLLNFTDKSKVYECEVIV